MWVMFLLLVCGCDFKYDSPKPAYIKRCIEGVWYLQTHSAVDGWVFTPLLLPSGKPSTCKE